MQNKSTERGKIIAKGVIQGHEAGGEVELEDSSQGQFVNLINYWVAEGAPDVWIYLSPDEAGDVTVDGVINLGELAEFSGNTRLEIPKGSSTQDLRSLVVYCKAYTVTFGVAVLEYQV